MKNKKICKILAIIILAIFTISFGSSFVYADDANYDITNYDGHTIETQIGNPVNTIAGMVIGVMRTIALGVALIMITVLAIKYMSAAPSERAEIKKSAVQYVVGAVVLFGCFGILTLIQNFTSTALPTS